MQRSENLPYYDRTYKAFQIGIESTRGTAIDYYAHKDRQSSEERTMPLTEPDFEPIDIMDYKGNIRIELEGISRPDEFPLVKPPMRGDYIPLTSFGSEWGVGVVTRFDISPYQRARGAQPWRLELLFTLSDEQSERLAEWENRIKS